MSGPAAAPSGDATALRVCVMNRTYVRRVRTPADGTHTNRCLCAQYAAPMPMKWLNQADCDVSRLQRELRGTFRFRAGGGRLTNRRDAMPPARGGGIHPLDMGPPVGPCVLERRVQPHQPDGRPCG